MTTHGRSSHLLIAKAIAVMALCTGGCGTSGLWGSNEERLLVQQPSIEGFALSPEGKPLLVVRCVLESPKGERQARYLAFPLDADGRAPQRFARPELEGKAPGAVTPIVLGDIGHELKASGVGERLPGASLAHPAESLAYVPAGARPPAVVGEKAYLLAYEPLAAYPRPKGVSTGGTSGAVAPGDSVAIPPPAPEDPALLGRPAVRYLALPRTVPPPTGMKVR